MTYAEKFKDPRWQKKRLKVLERDNWQCQECGDKETTLHVHHLRYLPNKAPWDYSNNDLLTLCSFCHEDETTTRPEYEDLLLEMLRIKKFMADDISCLTDFLIRASGRYHPQHLSQALRWNLWNKDGIKKGYALLDEIVRNFEYQGKDDG